METDKTGIKFLNRDLKWEFVEVKEAGTTRLKNLMYFKHQNKSSDLSPSQVVQVSDIDVFVLGGHQDYKSLLARKYNASRSCLQVNLKSGELIQRPNMIRGRQYFYPSVIGHKIYVLGGMT